jgi:hypothetical protein
MAAEEGHHDIAVGRLVEDDLRMTGEDELAAGRRSGVT